MSFDSCRRQIAAAASVLCCDPKDEDRHRLVKNVMAIAITVAIAIAANTDYAMPGCGAHLRFTGVRHRTTAVGFLHNTYSITCCYLPGFYTSTILHTA